MTKNKAFDILEIRSSNPTKEEIVKAYRILVIKYNTDQRTHYEEHVRNLLEEKFKEINNAKDYLDKYYV